eukprot:6193366-Pyramimonas_sp.AAC.1
MDPALTGGCSVSPPTLSGWGPQGQSQQGQSQQGPALTVQYSTCTMLYRRNGVGGGGFSSFTSPYAVPAVVRRLEADPAEAARIARAGGALMAAMDLHEVRKCVH